MIEKIMSMLSDMDDEQIKNVYDYVCDEYDEKNLMLYIGSRYMLFECKYGFCGKRHQS